MNRHVQRVLVDSLSRISAIDASDKDRYFLLYEAFIPFLSRIAEELEPPSFEPGINSFSLFAYLSYEFDLPEHLRFAGFKLIRSHHDPAPDQFPMRYSALFWLTLELAQVFVPDSIPDELKEKQSFPPDEFWVDHIPRVHMETGKVVLLGRKANTELTFDAYWVDYNGRKVVVRPDKIMRIKNQIRALQQADEHLHFPMTVQLFDIDAREDVLIPGAVVFLPDYLIDITSISQCFTPFGEMTSVYLLNKIRPFSDSHHLLIGNCVNQILDELIFNPEMEWKEIVSRLFRINELTWATYSDADTLQHIRTIKTHFDHLKNTIKYEFLNKGFQQEYCAVEPSFYAPEYGLQGRLDLLYEHPDPNKPRMIIELKSGKIFKPNSYGLNHPHYIQTLLYDLLIRASYPGGANPINYILYSVEEKDNLRHAPAIRDWQFEAIGIRNQLVVLECRLAKWTKNDHTLYEILQELNEHVVGFNSSDREHFYKNYEAARPVIRSYFDTYLTFLTREQMRSKLGVVSSDRKGQSQLWSSSSEEKDKQFLILRGLKVETDNSQDDNPLVVFRKTSGTNPLANFRTGDVIVTYPENRDNYPTRGQLFRCSLVENSAEKIVVRLRARQYKPIFLPGTNWCVEHDHLDSSFRQMNQSLVTILNMDQQQSEKFLGLRPPARPEASPITSLPPGMTDTQAQALSEMEAVQDHYLLWGPPGTGKTSILLRNFVAQKLSQKDNRLLLVGYTNRAVDEICSALLSIDHLEESQILRIGSRYGTDPMYRHFLIKERNQHISNRSQLLEMLHGTRIVCGTIASLSGQLELFGIVDFDYLVIDEASQILEPALIGLLSMGIPYVLIGDHKQLPAVVNQSLEETYTHQPELHDIGLYNLSNSYFERMFDIVQSSNWKWAFGILTHQGRMHRDLMGYPNQFFYENILEILPFDAGRQTIPLHGKFDDFTDLAHCLCSHRTIFIPTTDQNFLNHKVNVEEANRIVEIIRCLLEIRPNLDPAEIGIITPYRAQIATIRHALEEGGVDYREITVDTVERYQGGAKDVIIISYCINVFSQVHQLKESMTADGVDRKLNVAMTRAREQIIFLANEELMREHPLYEALLFHYHRFTPQKKSLHLNSGKMEADKGSAV